ncbi:MAG: hypothetical protein ABRQ31_05370 [Smithellaceae bacterium]
MPTCGECSLLIKSSAGVYVCGGKQNLCFNGKLSPETDAKGCMRFTKKAPEKAEEKK